MSEEKNYEKEIIGCTDFAVFAFGLLGDGICGSDGEEEASWYGEDFDAFSAAIDRNSQKKLMRLLQGSVTMKPQVCARQVLRLS